MAGSTFGNNIRVTSFGESHGRATGCVIDGLPAGFKLDLKELKSYVARRKPDPENGGTNRIEEDELIILSGLLDETTLGTPLTIMVENKDVKSSDYEEIKDIYRPGHGDVTYDLKYGLRDENGGGRASGRETLSRVIAGGIVVQMLKALGVSFESKVSYIGFMHGNDEAVKGYLDQIRNEGDSMGGICEVCVKGLRAGLGEPVFRKADALLTGAVMSIGAVKAVEIGDGIQASTSFGSDFNDEITEVSENGIKAGSNHAGGILAGITTGQDLVLKAHIKPVPSIRKDQHTVTKDNSPVILSVPGRHDVCIAPRVLVVVEAMMAISLMDLMMDNMHSKFSSMEEFYK